MSTPPSPQASLTVVLLWEPDAWLRRISSLFAGHKVMVERAAVHCAFCLKKQGVMHAFATQRKKSMNALPLESLD